MWPHCDISIQNFHWSKIFHCGPHNICWLLPDFHWKSSFLNFSNKFGKYVVLNTLKNCLEHNYTHFSVRFVSFIKICCPDCLQQAFYFMLVGVKGIFYWEIDAKNNPNQFCHRFSHKCVLLLLVLLVVSIRSNIGLIWEICLA